MLHYALPHLLLAHHHCFTPQRFILFGLFLITRTRGFNTILRGGEWGGIVVRCLVIAIILLGIGDGALRPALKPSADAKALRRAQRWAWLGFGLNILAAGLMTRTIYAIS